MNLAEMLSYADIQRLSGIARHYNCECSTNSKHELIQAILHAINRNDVVERMIKNLSETDMKFLNTFLFEQRNLFTLEEIIARIKQVHSSSVPAQKNEQDQTYNPRQMISIYKERGWLFNGTNTKTKYLFQFPEDLKTKISDILQRQFERKIVPTSDPSCYIDHHLLILNDISSLLQYVHQNEIKLTADGVMYKRQLQQLLDLMQVKEALPAKTAWRFGYGRKYKYYPDRFSFIYDYCYYNGYIREENETLILSDQGRERVRSKEKESLKDVYRFWMKLYKSPIYNLQVLVHWMNRLAVHWVTVDSLKQVLCPYIKKFYYDTAENILELRVIRMMMYLGLVRIGGDTIEPNHRIPAHAVVQMTNRGRLVVRGNYVHDDEIIPMSM